MKAAPRRGGKVVPRSRKRRLGTILVLVGLLGVLGGTFVVGALAGRLSLRPSAMFGSASKTPPRTDKPAPAPQPELTFYRELTAPLKPATPSSSPRPAAKRETTPSDASRTPDASRPAETARPGETSVELPARAELEKAQAANAGVTTTSSASIARADARYTVQVAAYNARAQADALRARLAGLGLEAYVTETDAGGSTRYRVRIGTYETAEEARQAAVRIAAQGQVATYVTTR